MTDLDFFVGRTVVVLLLRKRDARRRQNGGRGRAADKITPLDLQRDLLCFTFLYAQQVCAK